MFPRLREFFGLSTATLPAEVSAAIEGAVILPRPSDPEEGVRVFVALSGGGIRGAFLFDRDTARAKIAKRFPELTDAQKGRAVNYLAGRVAKAAAMSEQPKRRKSWIHDY